MARAFAEAHLESSVVEDVNSQAENREYSVYVYHFVENQHDGMNDWEMRFVTPDRDLAIDKLVSAHIIVIFFLVIFMF